jgi:hypothetical protein
MENPYQSPMAPLDSPNLPNAFGRRPGLVKHVRVVAILMIVQAVLELLMAAGLGTMAVVMPTMFRQMPNQRAVADRPPVEPQVMWLVPLVYGGMAAASLAAGVLHLVAGLRNYRFQGRTFGITALACGLLAIFTCYCLPTSAAICVYGLIVYLNREVSEAFQMREAGYMPDQIIATFLG